MQPDGMFRRQPRPNFNKKGQLICGVIQIFMGLFAILFAILSIVVRAGGFVYIMGLGFVFSIFMFVAGGLGVRSSISENTCPIIGCLVVSVFSMLAGFVFFAVEASAASTDAAYLRTHGTHDRMLAGSSSMFRSDKPDAALAIDILAILVGVIEFFAAIAQIEICSRTLSHVCSTSRPVQPSHQQVIYIQQPMPGQPMASGVVIPPTAYVIHPFSQPNYVQDQPPAYVQKVVQ